MIRQLVACSLLASPIAACGQLPPAQPRAAATVRAAAAPEWAGTLGGQPIFVRTRGDAVELAVLGARFTGKQGVFELTGTVTPPSGEQATLALRSLADGTRGTIGTKHARAVMRGGWLEGTVGASALSIEWGGTRLVGRLGRRHLTLRKREDAAASRDALLVAALLAALYLEDELAD